MPRAIKLKDLFEAQVPIVQIISYETQRIHAEVNSVEIDWYSWNRCEGLRKWKGKRFEQVDSEEDADPTDVLEWFEGKGETLALVLEDYHPDLEEPSTIRRLRNIAARKSGDDYTKMLVLSQPFPKIPPELEKDIYLYELPLPQIKDLEVIYKNILPDTEPEDVVLEAALGLTIMEAERAFRLALVQTGDNYLTATHVPLIVQEKEQIIKKSGFLEYYHPDVELKDVGGIDQLKNWLDRRKAGFDRGAQTSYHLDNPRGVLLLGIPGTGKSLSAKAIASAWDFPLLKMDIGRIFGGIVGESERNIREALRIAEALSPSILWLDEIEKGLSGSGSSGSTDGGTTARVFGTMLTWMQDKKSPVFVVATANDISQLPPELLRKGRFDEIFFVDLPDATAREEIFDIHLEKRKRKLRDYDLPALVKASIYFSGAEIEEAIREALFAAYAEGEELQTKHLLQALAETHCLAHTMRETVEAMRKWAKHRARFAASKPGEALEQQGKKSTPRLKQEAHNPFITS